MLKSLFQQECIKRGVLFIGLQMPSFMHSDRDIEHTLQVYSTVLKIVASAVRGGRVKELLNGKPIQPVFRKG